jgi:hypothetical protein
MVGEEILMLVLFIRLAHALDQDENFARLLVWKARLWAWGQMKVWWAEVWLSGNVKARVWFWSGGWRVSRQDLWQTRLMYWLKGK